MHTVADSMRTPVLVEGSATIQEASARMVDVDSDVAVVVDGGVVSGLLVAQDVVRALAPGLGRR